MVQGSDQLRSREPWILNIVLHLLMYRLTRGLYIMHELEERLDEEAESPRKLLWRWTRYGMWNLHLALIHLLMCESVRGLCI